MGVGMRGDAGARSGVEGREVVRGVEGAVDRYAEGVVGLSPLSRSLYPDGVLDRPETDPLGVGARAEDMGVGARADDGVVERTGMGAELDAGMGGTGGRSPPLGAAGGFGVRTRLGAGVVLVLLGVVCALALALVE